METMKTLYLFLSIVALFFLHGSFSFAYGDSQKNDNVVSEITSQNSESSSESKANASQVNMYSSMNTTDSSFEGGTFYVEWEDASGDKTISGNGTSLEITPTNNQTDNFVKAVIHLTLDGSKTYETGELKIRLPRYIFNNIDGGKLTDKTITGIDTSGRASSFAKVDVGVPFSPATSQETDFNYYIDNDDIIITNYKKIANKITFDCSISWTYRPELIVNEGSFSFSFTINDINKTNDLIFNIKTESVKCSDIKITKKERYIRWQDWFGNKPDLINNEDANDYDFVYYDLAIKNTNGTQRTLCNIESSFSSGYVVSYATTLFITSSYTYTIGGSLNNKEKYKILNNISLINANSSNLNIDFSYNSLKKEFIDNWYANAERLYKENYTIIPVIVAYKKETINSTGFQAEVQMNVTNIGFLNKRKSEKLSYNTYNFPSLDFKYPAGNTITINKDFSYKSNQNATYDALYSDNESTIHNFLITSSVNAYASLNNSSAKKYVHSIYDDIIFLNGEQLNAGDYYFKNIRVSEEQTYDKEYLVDPDTGKTALTKSGIQTLGLFGRNNSENNANFNQLSSITLTENEQNNSFKEKSFLVDDSLKKCNEIRITEETNSASSSISIYFDLVLCPTEHVKDIISKTNGAKITCTNVAATTCELYDENNNIVENLSPKKSSNSGSLSDIIDEHDRKYFGNNVPYRSSKEITLIPYNYDINFGKTVGLYKNDTTNKEILVNTKLATNSASGTAITTLLSYGADATKESLISTYKKLPEQIRKNAFLDDETFYDLLPPGCFVQEKDIQAYICWGTNTATHAPGAFIKKINIIENYKGTGQTLLSVTVGIDIEKFINSLKNSVFDNIYNAYFTDSPLKEWGTLVSFNMHVPYEAIDDYGKIINNYAAVHVTNQKTAYKDDPTQSSVIPSELKNAFTDLDQDGNENALPEYNYAKASLSLNTTTASQSGLTLQVRTNNSLYSDSQELKPNDKYEYKIRYSSEKTNKSKNIIIFNSLENENNNSWHGLLSQLDTTQIEKSVSADDATATCKPVIYYSTVKGLNLTNEANRNLSDVSKWTTTPPSDLSNVTAFVVDASKTSKGTDFVLGEGKSLLIHAYMTAPRNAYGYTGKEKAATNAAMMTVSTQSTSSTSWSSPVLEKTSQTIATLSDKLGNLRIAKTVVGTNDEKSTDWTFKIKLAESSTTINGFYDDGEKVEFINGEATCTLHDGESITIKNLPSGTTYSVTELEAADLEKSGWRCSSENSAGKIPSGLETITTSFVNSHVTTLDLPMSGGQGIIGSLFAASILAAIGTFIIGYRTHHVKNNGTKRNNNLRE